jgi:hypothetical protein
VPPPVLEALAGEVLLEAVPDHERNCSPLLLGKRQELRRKPANNVAIERHGK